MESVFYDIAIVIVIASVLAILAVTLRQPLIPAYILTGLILGPAGGGWVENIPFLNGVSHVGVTLLLFLAGSVLSLDRLKKTWKSTLWATIPVSVLFFGMMSAIFLILGFESQEALVAGSAMIFSSTILTIKLMPTTTLHQQSMGSLAISILIFQDLIAVGMLLFFRSSGSSEGSWWHLPVFGIVLFAGLLLFERYILRWALHRVERYREVLLLSTLGWCFTGGLLSHLIGFSFEIGAFLAGISLARNPIALYLTEQLRFFRDFFLMLFFFSLGTQMRLDTLGELFLPSMAIAIAILVVKPLVFYLFLRIAGEPQKINKQLALRLGQGSEFSLIVAAVTVEALIIPEELSQLIYLSVVWTLMISSLITVRFLPTPHGNTIELKRD